MPLLLKGRAARPLCIQLPLEEQKMYPRRGLSDERRAPAQTALGPVTPDSEPAQP